MRAAMRTGCSVFRALGDTSAKASSMETCCTWGVSLPMMAMMARDTSRYLWKLPPVQMASGHSRAAVEAGMAERTPKARAS